MSRLKMSGKEVVFFIGVIFCGQVIGMGDRWAWSSHVSSRRSEVEAETENHVIVQEIESDSDSKSSYESEGESQRTARKVETENPEARFFLKDKLCAIGLADCSNDLSDVVQYQHKNFNTQCLWRIQ